jgi:hypothetical protein
MNTIMIDYDLVLPGQQYHRIIEYIRSHDGWAHALKSTWLISTSKTASQVRDDILRFIDANDKVLVSDVTNAPMAWYGLPDAVSEWIKNNIGRSPLFR